MMFYYLLFKLRLVRPPTKLKKEKIKEVKIYKKLKIIPIFLLKDTHKHKLKYLR